MGFDHCAVKAIAILTAVAWLIAIAYMPNMMPIRVSEMGCVGTTSVL